MKEKKIDLILFAGQSNMAGRGDSIKIEKVSLNYGYEFRAISDPTKLYSLEEPFGVNENNINGINEPNMKTGSMVSSLVWEYWSRTNRTVVAVSASKGGSSIAEWQPEGKFLKDSINRINLAKNWLEKNNYKVDNCWLIWCQGETDGDIGTTYSEYQKLLKNMIENLEENGIMHSFVIQIGNHRDDKDRYQEIIRAQQDFCNQYKNTTMLTTIFEKMNELNLMKDEFHYKQEGYHLCGKEAGKNLAIWKGTSK